MKGQLLNKFIGFHPNFIDELKTLPDEIYLKLIKKFNDENNDELNFKSIISEFRFGQFFQSSGFYIQYEKVIHSKTPDWFLEFGGESAICEIKRVNPVNATMIVEDLYRHIESKCISLNIGLVASICSDINNKSKLPNKLHLIEQLDKQLYKIKSFLTASSRKKLSIELSNENDATCLKLFISKLDIQHKSSTIEWIYGPDSIVYDIRRVYGSEIIAKIEKYKPIISTDLKFYIGIDIQFDNGITPMEVFNEFIGSGWENIDTKEYGSILGKFYKDEVYSVLDGIIIRYNSKFHFISNPRKNHTLNYKLTSCTQKISE